MPFNKNFKDDILVEIKTLEEEISSRTKFLNNVFITVSWGAIVLLLTFNFKDILNLDNSIKEIFFSSFFFFSMSLFFTFLENSLYRDYFGRILVFKKYALMYSQYKTDELKDKMYISLKRMDTRINIFMRNLSTIVKSITFYLGLVFLVFTIYFILF